MARVGFKKAKYNKIDYETNKYKALTSQKVPDFEKVVDEKFAPEFNNGELYANDALAESDNTFKKGTLSLTVADDNDKLCAELLGNQQTEDGEVTSNVNDVAPEFGYGHIIPKIVNGVRKYKVEFFPRVKFTKITGDNKSKGENVEFGTAAVEATVYPLEKDFNGLKAGDWERHNTFDNLTSAEEYLDELLTPTVAVTGVTI